MKKYLSVFTMSFQQELTYRMNFVMWRVRNVLQIFVTFFLWDSIFAAPGRELFGYDRAKILTYVIGLLFVRAIVLSAKAQDVAGEVARGELSNYLVKPVSYFKYWFTRDIASKFLNLGFALVELSLLAIFLRPPIFIQTNLMQLLLFALALLLALVLFFLIIFITNAIPFWAPDVAWGGHFLVSVILIEFLSGSLFPLDVLPANLQTALSFTPFPYLIFFPLQIYLGKVSGLVAAEGIAVAGVWIFILVILMQSVWARGLKAYQAYGR